MCAAIFPNRSTAHQSSAILRRPVAQKSFVAAIRTDLMAASAQH
jgi:hypothetical protein